MDTAQKLIAIVGQTASGKSALAMEIAQRFGGELICADSRTIYKGMDIGTGKPTKHDQNLVAHHGLDLVSPGEKFTVADFQKYANQAVFDISNREQLPILVGGSGLYVDSVILEYSFNDKPDDKLRQTLEAKSISELQDIIVNSNIAMPINSLNKRHLIRQIETGGMSRVSSVRPDTLVIGIDIDKVNLEKSIRRRIDKMFTDELTSEVECLRDKYGWNSEPMKSIGYKEFVEYFDGNKTLEEIKEDIAINTIRFAKRQKTWFRRNKSIHWIKKEDYVDLVTTFLNKYDS